MYPPTVFTLKFTPVDALLSTETGPEIIAFDVGFLY
jgi:hypothetical protein